MATRSSPAVSNLSPARFSTRTVINIGSSSPRIPSPASFLSRTGASRPVLRRGSTHSDGSEPRLDVESLRTRDGPPVPSDRDVYAISSDSSQHAEQNRAAAEEPDHTLMGEPGAIAAPVTCESSSTSPHDGRATGKRKRATKISTIQKEHAPRQRKPSTEVSARVALASIESNTASATVTSHACIAVKAKKPRASKKDKAVESGPSTTRAKRGKKAADPTATKQRKKNADCPLETLRASVSVSPKNAKQSASVNPPVDIPICTDVAPVRRRSWTPVHDNKIDLAVEAMQHASESPTRASPGKFTLMLDRYSFEVSEPAPAALAVAKKTTTTTTTKRPLKGVQGVPRTRRKATKDPTKEKPVKKPRTLTKRTKKPADRLKNITDHALAPYRPQGSNVGDMFSIQSMLTGRKNGSMDGSDDDDYAIVSIDRPCTVGTGVMGLIDANERPQGTSSKDHKIGTTALQEAQDLVRNQELVFGTSSQLAKENSPGTLRQIRQAIEDSEEMALLSQQMGYSPSTSRVRVVTAPHGTSLSIAPSAGKLWGVSSRDADNRTLAAEIRQPKPYDGTNSRPRLESADTPMSPPPPVLVVSSSPAFEDWTTELPVQQEDKHDSGFFDISDIERRAGLTSDPVSVGIDLLRQGSDLVERKESELQTCPNRTIDLESARPDEEHVMAIDVGSVSCGDAIKVDSVKKVSSSKSVDKPSRAKKVKQLVPKQSAAVKTAPVVPKTPATPRRRKAAVAQHEAPKSDKSSRWQDIDEILDSEEERSLSPRRRLTKSTPCRAESVQPLELSPDAATLGERNAPPTSKAVKAKTQPSQADKNKGEVYYTSMYAQITATVKAAPASRDPTHPSWHEKMLLYDPIVLEDLTDWLNERGLRVTCAKPSSRTTIATSKKRSAAPTKSDVSSADSELETKELEPWMVQKWCESQSVCCLWREGLRGGVRCRY